MKNEGPRIVLEQKEFTHEETDWPFIRNLISAYAVTAEKATAEDKRKAEWKIVRVSEATGTTNDVFYMNPDAGAQLNAGKIAQLVNRISTDTGRLEVRKVEEK